MGQFIPLVFRFDRGNFHRVLVGRKPDPMDQESFTCFLPNLLNNSTTNRLVILHQHNFVALGQLRIFFLQNFSSVGKLPFNISFIFFGVLSVGNSEFFPTHTFSHRSTFCLFFLWRILRTVNLHLHTLWSRLFGSPIILKSNRERLLNLK